MVVLTTENTTATEELPMNNARIQDLSSADDEMFTMLVVLMKFAVWMKASIAKVT